MTGIRIEWKRIRRRIKAVDHKILMLMCSSHGIIVTVGTVVACIATIQFHAILGIIFSTFSMYIKDMGVEWSRIGTEIDQVISDGVQELATAAGEGISNE